MKKRSREHIPDCPCNYNPKKFLMLHRTISKREGTIKILKCTICGRVVEED
jgi:hypothetical protein